MKKVQGEGTKCLEAGQGAGGLEEVLVEWRKCWGSLRGAGGVEEVLLEDEHNMFRGVEA